jgi:hypothetical protein
LRNYEELKAYNPEGGPAIQEQLRLLAATKSYLEECLGLAEITRVSALLEFRKWETQFPY